MRASFVHRIAWFTAAAVMTAMLVFVLVLLPEGSAPAGGRVGSATAETDGDSLPGKGKFLVASGTIFDPSFQETVILLVGYDETGATGLIINRPTKIPLAKVLMDVPGLEKRSDVVYYGGPVEGQRMFMLIRSDQKLEGADRVFSNVYVSVSRNILELMIGANKTQKQLRAYSGYAGWLPGNSAERCFGGTGTLSTPMQIPSSRRKSLKYGAN